MTSAVATCVHTFRFFLISYMPGRFGVNVGSIELIYTGLYTGLRSPCGCLGMKNILPFMVTSSEISRMPAAIIV